MWYFALATVILFESTFCLPQYDLANRDVYEIQEDKGSNSVKFVHPRPAEPVLREITYYHLIERPYDRSVQTDKIVDSIDDRDLSTERPTTNAHGHEFEIDDHSHDQTPCQLDHLSDQITEQPHQEHHWYLHPSEKPAQVLDQQFDQIQPSAIDPDDWFYSSFIINDQPSPNPDQVIPSVVQQQDWASPVVKEEQEPIPPSLPMGNGRPSLIWHPTLLSTSTEAEIIQKAEEESISAGEVTVSPLGENPEIENEDVAVDPAISEVVEAEVVPENPSVAIENPEEIAAESNPANIEGIVQEEIPALEITDLPESHIMIPGQIAAEPNPLNAEGIVQEEVSEHVPTDLINPEKSEEETSETETAVVENPEVESEPAEIEGEVEVIEDPILTAAIIDSEGDNAEEQRAGDEEVVEEAMSADGDVQQTISDQYFQLYQSPAVLQDRYEKLRRYLPNVNLPEPPEENAEMEHTRKRRSAMQPEEDFEYIPEAPVLPPLNYDILPDYIRAIISTEKPSDDEEVKVEKESQTEEHKETGMADTIGMVQVETGLPKEEVEEELEKTDGVVNLDSKQVRTYGMSLNGDHGIVWNDMFTNPGMAYNVGEDGEVVESHKEEPLIPEPPVVEGHPIPEDNEDETQKPVEHIGGLEPNHEGGQTVEAGGDIEDIFVDIDKEKNKQPPHFLVKPEVVKPIVGISEHKEEADDDVDGALNELLKNKKFWSWLADWTSTYMDLFTEKFAQIIQEEISRIPAAKPIADEKAVIEMNADKDEAQRPIEEADQTKTLFINGKEISLTRTSNLDGELDGDIINEDMLRRGHNDNNNGYGKEQVKVISKAIYGNTIGNEKVTNIFVFFPEKENKDEEKPDENTEIPIEGNVSSTTEDSDITNPEESSADKIEQSKEPAESSIVPEVTKEPEETSNTNSEIINPVDVEPTTEPITKEDSVSEPVNSEVPVETSAANPDTVETSKEENQPTTEREVRENSDANQPDITTELSTQPNLEESSIPIAEEATTEAPIISEINTDIVTPILSVTEEPKTSEPIDEASTLVLSITEEPKTSEPIAEAVTPSESNSESTVDPEGSLSVEESIPEGGEQKIEKNSETIDEASTPVLPITEEPKTSEPIDEVVTPSESNSESTVAPEESPTVESFPEGGEQNIEKNSETVTENSEVSEAKPEDSSVAPTEESPKEEEKIESSSELPSNEGNTGDETTEATLTEAEPTEGIPVLNAQESLTIDNKESIPEVSSGSDSVTSEASTLSSEITNAEEKAESNSEVPPSSED